jgi:hypothetical protein
MPGSGAIDKKDKWRIVIEVKGPLSKPKADKLTFALNAFLKKHKATMTRGKTLRKGK